MGKITLPCKICTKCKQSKTIDLFHKDKTKKIGVASRCKECRKEHFKQRYIKKKNKVYDIPPGHRRCFNSTCTTPIQPEDQFISSYVRRTKPTKWCLKCRTINKKTQINPTTKIGKCRQAWIQWQKSHSCADCGLNDYRVIQADHEHSKVYRCSDYKWWSIHGGVPALNQELHKCTPRCAFCHALKTKERHGEVKRRPSTQQKYKILDSMKIERGCETCGRKCTKETTQAFHFDHKDPSKKTIGPSRIVFLSWVNFYKKLPEVEACGVMCVNCHHLKTHYQSTFNGSRYEFK